MPDVVLPPPARAAVAEVVPLRKLPPRLAWFDYLIPPGIAVVAGQLVEVPFRRETLCAVVVRVKHELPNPRFRYETVAAFRSAGPIVTEAQRRLAAWLAEEYVQSLATVYRAMLPEFPRRFSPQLHGVAPEHQRSEMPAAVPRNELWLGRLEPGAVAERITSLLGQGRQALVLTPELRQAASLHQCWQRSWGAAVVVQPERQLRLRSLDFWRRGLSGEPLVVIGTRRGIFAPLPNLSLIVCLQEDDPSFKQWDQQPRYQATAAARKLAAWSTATVVYQTPAPTVTAWHAGLMGKLTVEERPSLSTITTRVDLRSEPFDQRYRPLSLQLRQQLREVLDRGRGLRALLLVNRKGTAAWLRCQGCGFIPRCPNCGLPFAYDPPPAGQVLAIVEDLHCYRCLRSTLSPPTCPTCRSADLRPVGSGARRVAAAVRDLHPTVPVATFDAQVLQANRAAWLDQLAEGQIGVLVATKAALALPELGRPPLVAVISADGMLQQPDFRAAERTWQLLRRAHALAGEQLLVQTLLPGHPVYQALLENRPARFYQAELAVRRELGYPPFGRLIRLLYRHGRAAVARGTAERVATELQAAFPSSLAGVEVLGPAQSRTVRRKSATVMEIVLKVPVPAADSTLRQQLGDALVGKLRSLPEGWVVDVDPEEL